MPCCKAKELSIFIWELGAWHPPVLAVAWGRAVAAWGRVAVVAVGASHNLVHSPCSGS